MIKENGEISPPLKCATCPISCGCSWECIRGDDLAEIYVLSAALQNVRTPGRLGNIRARKSEYCEDWHVEQNIPCINGLSAWFVIATAEEADEASMGYTDGAIGTAEERANQIVVAISQDKRGNENG